MSCCIAASSFIEQLVPNTFLSRFSNSFLRFCLRETSTGPVRQISDHRFRDWEQLLHDSVTVSHLSAVQPQGLDLRPRSSPDRLLTHHVTALRFSLDQTLGVQNTGGFGVHGRVIVIESGVSYDRPCCRVVMLPCTFRQNGLSISTVRFPAREWLCPNPLCRWQMGDR